MHQHRFYDVFLATYLSTQNLFARKRTLCHNDTWFRITARVRWLYYNTQKTHGVYYIAYREFAVRRNESAIA